jgi:hypothetical protein
MNPSSTTSSSVQSLKPCSSMLTSTSNDSGYAGSPASTATSTVNETSSPNNSQQNSSSGGYVRASAEKPHQLKPTFFTKPVICQFCKHPFSLSHLQSSSISFSFQAWITYVVGSQQILQKPTTHNSNLNQTVSSAMVRNWNRKINFQNSLKKNSKSKNIFFKIENHFVQNFQKPTPIFQTATVVSTWIV